MVKDVKLINLLKETERFAIKTEEIALMITMLGLLAVILIQIVARYILEFPTPWAEETARYLFIWMSWVGAARAFVDFSHIEMDLMNTVIDFFAGSNAAKYKDILTKISLITTGCFLLVFTIIYNKFLASILSLGQHSPATGINMGIPMAGVLVGSVLMIYHIICRLIYTNPIEITQSDMLGGK